MRLKRTAHVAVTAGLCTAMMLNSTPMAAIAEEIVGSDAPALEQTTVAEGQNAASEAASKDVDPKGAVAAEGTDGAAAGETSDTDAAGETAVPVAAAESPATSEDDTTADSAGRAAAAGGTAADDVVADEPAATADDAASEGDFKIGGQAYASLKEAVDAVKTSTNKTIVLSKDASGDGVAVPSGTDFTLDLGGHTYTVDGATVGSPNTETNGFQLLQNSTITIKNGTIRSDNAAILIQNYSNLTLENVKLVGGTATQYTLSNNNGNTVIGAGTQIVAGTAGGKVAFDVCGFRSYKSVSVTVKPGAVITGPIELCVEAGDHTAKLDIQGGDLSQASLVAASGAEKVQVKKADSVQLAAPAGHQWVGNQLVKAEQDKVAVVIGADGTATQYATVSDAVKSANGQTVSLLADVQEDVVVEEGVTAAIDLAGHKITNNGNHTITNKGTLTVRDSAGGGVVDNITHARAAVFNKVGATATLEAGTFSRSMEASKDENNSGGNSYYTLLNHGAMTIKGGVTVCQGSDNKGQFSSLVENGWQNGGQNTTKAPSIMTIEGGRFVGGLNTIKNDDYGQLTIKGGSFENVKQAAVLNWNVAEISGGTFDSQKVAVLNGKLDDVADKGELVITGGTFKAPTIVEKMSGANTSGSVEISGGTFKGAFPAPEKIDGSLEISGGTFSHPSAEEFVVPGSGLEIDENGQLGVAQVKLVFAESVKEGVYTYDVKGGKAPAIDLLSLVHLNVTNQSGNYSVVLPDSAANEALHKAVAEADTSKVHEIKVQALDGNKVVDEQVLKVQLTDSAAPAPVAKVTVTFETGAGDSFTRVVEAGSKLERPADPELEGWEFKGWFKVKNADGTLSDEWNFDEDAVSEDMTLYGGWVKKGAAASQKPAKPGSALPTTGDASMIGVAAAGAAGALAIAGGYLASKRRKQ